MATCALRCMDQEMVLNELQKTLRHHGYSPSSSRSYRYYAKDFLMWLKTKQSLGKPVFPKNCVVSYGLHLKEERSLGDSAINQGICSVSFLMQHVLKKEDLEINDTVPSSSPRRLNNGG